MLLYSINKEYIALKNHFARLEKCKASFSGQVFWNSGDLTNLHLIKPVARVTSRYNTKANRKKLNTQNTLCSWFHSLAES